MIRTPFKPAAHRSAHRSAARRRGGFTLIELMVVISIILILVAVSIAGISQLAKHTKAQRTTTSLESAKSIMAGYVAGDASQASLKALYNKALNTPFIAGGPGQDLDSNSGCLVATKGANGEHKWSVLSQNPALAAELEFTARVMQVLLRVPENRQAVDKLPSEAKFILTDDTGVALTGVPPLLADGNGEPILFVPPAGLQNVTVNGNNGIVQSDGRLHPTTGTDPAPNPLSGPFWASSGPDRDYSAGDDNAYSVHQ